MMTARLPITVSMILLILGLMAHGPALLAQSSGQLILEDFRHEGENGLPVGWQNESGRNEASARESYKIQSEQETTFLAVRHADQRIKKKKIDWNPKTYPIMTWRWRLHQAPADAEPIAVVYVALDTDLLFIPVFTKYVWSAMKAEGTLDEGGMFSGSEIVVRGGVKPLGEWIEERVNVYEDFKRIHNHEPADRAWGISLLGGRGVEIDFGPLAVSAP
jgi:Protein of unknown function (DUF3047)